MSTSDVLTSLQKAKRPVLIVGAGARHQEARELSRLLGIPVAPTWGALDMFPAANKLTIGSFGTHGTRHGNFAVQNADWILSVGSRLDTKATGTPESTFAPRARKFVVDIDQPELNKFARLGIAILGIRCDAGVFLRDMVSRVNAVQTDGSFPVFDAWLARIDDWRNRYPLSTSAPYAIIGELSSKAKDGDIICCDTGCTVAWITQAWRFKEGQRLLHAWNQTPMGYGLPAAIGAHYATGKPVLLITGDGSLMMSVGDLATIKGLPITVVLMNNQGHAMCRQTQREWFDGRYEATSIEGGLKFPNFTAVAKAFEIDLVEHHIDPDCDVIPKVKYGYPNHDAHPLLDREELAEQMLNETAYA